MPKCRDKIRLQKYLLNHGSADALTRHLLLEGYGEDVVADGLESFVAGWEESVHWIVKLKHNNAQGILEEFQFDLYKRTELFSVSRYANEEQLACYMERIQKADQMFGNATIQSEDAYVFPDTIETVDRNEHWWLFRIPAGGIY